MKIQQEKISISLNKEGLLPIYVVSGDEPLLIQDTCDTIRKACRDQGFNERIVFEVDGKFNWSIFTDETNSLSLFSAQKIIEIRLKNGKVNKDGTAALLNYLQTTSPETVVILQSPKFERAETNKKWFKEADKVGGIITIWPIDKHKLPQWISARAAGEGISLDREALELLVERTEGNLLAAAQELQKLSLLTKENPVNSETILAAVAESSRYAVFDLVNTLLERDTRKSLHILNHLLAEGVQPTIILWALTRQARQFYELMSSKEAFSRLRLPPKTKSALQKYLTNLNKKAVDLLIEKSHQVDKSIKGSKEMTVSESLTVLVLAFCDPKLAT